MANTGKFPKCGALAAQAKPLTLAGLEDLCDDPARDLPGGTEVRALLAFDPEHGFFLSARDGDTVHPVVDRQGAPLRFRTIEAALAALQDVAGLSPEIGLFQARPAARRH